MSRDPLSGFSGNRGPSINSRDETGRQRPWTGKSSYGGGSRGASLHERDLSGNQRPWTPDPLRDRASEWTEGGYMRSGYDTGRVW